MNPETLIEIARRFNLIAGELETAATALPARLSGQSRQLDAWARRIRHDANGLEQEADQPTELQDSGHSHRKAKEGLTTLEKGLAVAALVTTLADLPAAAQTALDAAQQGYEPLVEFFAIEEGNAQTNADQELDANDRRAEALVDQLVDDLANMKSPLEPEGWDGRKSFRFELKQSEDLGWDTLNIELETVLDNEIVIGAQRIKIEAGVGVGFGKPVTISSHKTADLAQLLTDEVFTNARD